MSGANFFDLSGLAPIKRGENRRDKRKQILNAIGLCPN